MTAITLKEKAYSELRRLIVNGDLKPGEVLTEIYLAGMLGMSRTPIRAALERLDVEGLAKYTPNKGLIVAEMSLDRVIDFFDFRAAIECHVIRKLAVRSWIRQDLQWFEDNLQEQATHVENNDIVAFTAADTAFHRKLAQLYDNAEIVQTMERMQDQLHQVGLKVLRKDLTRIQASYADHERIFRLIAQGDGEGAAKQMEEHLEYGKRILIM